MISKDWENRHGHPLLLVETFVEKGRFTGTCYRAAGWKVLGETKGYGRNAKKYYYHGIKKAENPTQEECKTLGCKYDDWDTFVYVC